MAPPGVTVRKAVPDDAAALIEHVNRIAEEAGRFIPMEPGEFTMTLEQERQLLADVAASGNSVFLVAEADGGIIGVCNCSGGKRKALRHAATLGISVRKSWCGRGVGHTLLLAAIAWARESGVLTRIELQVYADNDRAIRLYRRCGFQPEGLRRRAARRSDEEYVDDVVMALLL